MQKSKKIALLSIMPTVQIEGQEIKKVEGTSGPDIKCNISQVAATVSTRTHEDVDWIDFFSDDR